MARDFLIQPQPKGKLTNSDRVVFASDANSALSALNEALFAAHGVRAPLLRVNPNHVILMGDVVRATLRSLRDTIEGATGTHIPLEYPPPTNNDDLRISWLNRNLSALYGAL